MEGISEPTIKPEKEDKVYSEYKGEGTQLSGNLSENVIFVKDFFQIKAEPKQRSDCIKKEVKDEVEARFEEWEEFETEERDCFPGCVEGDLTEMSPIPLTHTGFAEVFRKVKVGSQDAAEFDDVALETVSYAAEGKNIKPEEELWCQVTLNHNSSEVKSERMYLSGCEKDHLVRVSAEKVIPVHQNKENFEESEENLRKKFGCEREAVVKHGRHSMDATHPEQWINSKREQDHVMKETVMPDSNAKSLPQGPKIAEDPGSHLNNKGGSTELKEPFSGRNIFGHLSAKAFDKSYVNQHSQFNNKERQFSHNHGSYVGNNKGDLNICSTQNMERKFECAQCSYKTNRKSHFTRHCLNHGDIRKFVCAQCSYKTNYRSDFTQHCLTHTNIKKFACDQCSYKTNRKSYLTKHCLNHSNIRKFACDQCSYKTNYKSNMTQHCINHSSVKKFACGQCSYKTNNKGNFSRHYINHSNIKKFACDQCSYKTNEKGCLTLHCLSHTNIKQYACGQCSYKTNNKSNFTEHCTSHTNVKKFSCDHCSYKTNYRSAFTQHSLNHSNIRKFVCDQCSYKTNNKGNFARHCINHSNIKKFACDQCSYKSNRKEYFTKHCLIHKKQENL